MLRKNVMIALSALSVFALGAVAAQTLHQPGPYDTEPILVVHLGGSTLSGPVAGSLLVYSDGQMMTSGLSESGGAVVGTTTLTSAQVAELRQRMREAHMQTLGDQTYFAYDVPITTVTAFADGAGQKANTFSYSLANGDYAAVHAAIQSIVDVTVKTK